jgi:PAS domain S-box-containing protein
MASQLRILYLEDNSIDVQLVADTLEAGGVDCALIDVEDRDSFVNVLAAGPPDVIFSDYTLPSYSGLEALEDARRLQPDVPFIFVSGTIGEENAIESLRRGATDYVFKQNLRRLVPVVHRALAEQKERMLRRKAEDLIRQKEQRFSAFMRNLPGVAFIKDKDRRYVYLNEAAEDYICQSALECLGRRDEDLLPPMLASRMRESDEQVLSEKRIVQVVEDINLRGPARRWFTTKFPIMDKYGAANWLGGVGIDITGQEDWHLPDA